MRQQAMNDILQETDIHCVTTASYRTWIDEYLEEPDKRRLALAALDAFDRIENAAMISEDDLAPIIEASSCRFVRVWEIGVDLLYRLARQNEVARNGILKMFRDRKAAIRFQAIVMLGWANLSPPFTKSLIRLGLRDKSHQVRSKLAEVACRHGFADLIPDLEASLATETHSGARESLEFCLALLRDGYLLQRIGGKLTGLWVKGERNLGWCISVPITEDDLRAGKLDEIIASARSIGTQSLGPIPEQRLQEKQS
jgi:hypothetical protein